MSEAQTEKWPPEKCAIAAQYLVNKKLDRIRENMPPEVFVAWASSLELLLDPLEQISRG